MRTLFQAVAVCGALASPAWAQEAPAGGETVAAPPDLGALLEALTCREFLALGAQDQRTAMLALRALYNGDPLPDEPLPIGLDAGVGGADGQGGGPGASGAGGPDTEPSAEEAAAVVAEATAAEPVGEGEGQDGADPPDETGIVDGENESGKTDTDGTELAATGEPGDAKLTGMRTSCEGGPEALALDAMRAAHADYD